MFMQRVLEINKSFNTNNFNFVNGSEDALSRELPLLESVSELNQIIASAKGEFLEAVILSTSMTESIDGVLGNVEKIAHKLFNMILSLVKKLTQTMKNALGLTKTKALKRLKEEAKELRKKLPTAKHKDKEYEVHMWKYEDYFKFIESMTELAPMVYKVPGQDDIGVSLAGIENWISVSEKDFADSAKAVEGVNIVSSLVKGLDSSLGEAGKAAKLNADKMIKMESSDIKENMDELIEANIKDHEVETLEFNEARDRVRRIMSTLEDSDIEKLEKSIVKKVNALDKVTLDFDKFINDLIKHLDKGLSEAKKNTDKSKADKATDSIQSIIKDMGELQTRFTKLINMAGLIGRENVRYMNSGLLPLQKDLNLALKIVG